MVGVLSQVLDLKIKQSDYTNTFSQAPLKDYLEVYIRFYHEFDISKDREYVLVPDNSVHLSPNLC